MQTKNYALLAAVLLAMTLFFANTDVNAQCASNDPACGQFGTNTIQFLGTDSTNPDGSPVKCNLPAGSTTFVPCTRYRYQFNGSSTNQINVAIPKVVMTKFTSSDKTVAGCSQLVTNGSGDPTTNFGINLLTHNICRVAITGTALSAPFALYADPSSPNLDSWQVRQSSTQVFPDSLLGPAVPAAPVAETAATLTTSEGVAASYSVQNGTIVPGPGIKDVLPAGHTKLCTLPSNIDPSTTTFPNNWTCQTISFATEQCDIKTTGSDPCRYIGGSCLLY